MKTSVDVKNMPKWGFIFIVLYVVNFAFLMGGAIGGALNAGFAYRSAQIAANYEKSTGRRVFACVGLWILSVILEIFLVIIISSLFAKL